jgi:hypothetical protein
MLIREIVIIKYLNIKNKNKKTILRYTTPIKFLNTFKKTKSHL